MYVCLDPFCCTEEVAPHCKSTVLEKKFFNLKIKKKEKVKKVTSELRLVGTEGCNPGGNSKSKGPGTERHVGCLRTK